METQRSSLRIRSVNRAHEVIEKTHEDALSIAASEKTLGRDLNPEEIAGLKALNAILGDRAKLAALLSDKKVTKPTALPESVELSDRDILDFLHLPDTIPVRSIIMIMAEGIPEDEIDKLLTSSVYGQLKTVFMETVRKNGENWIQILENQNCDRTKFFLLWNFARLCTAEIIGLRNRTLDDMRRDFMNSRHGGHEIHSTDKDKEYKEENQRREGYELEGQLGDEALMAYNLLLSDYRFMNSVVMERQVLSEQLQIVDKGYWLNDLKRPWLSPRDRQMLTDETIVVDPDHLKRIQFSDEKHIFGTEIYKKVERHVIQKGALYGWVHALAKKMPGDDEKQKIIAACDALERQKVILKLMMINAEKLGWSEDKFPEAFEYTRGGGMLGGTSLAQALLDNDCEVVDGLIVPREDANGVKSAVVELMTPWKEGSERQHAIAKSKAAEVKRLKEERVREYQELNGLINKCEAAYKKVDETIDGSLVEGLADLVIALQNVEKAKRTFRECGDAALLELNQDLEYTEAKHWIAKRFESSAATKKIHRLKEQLLLLTSLWEDESCHFEKLSVEPLVRVENGLNMKVAADAAKAVAETRSIAEKLRLEFAGGTLYTFHQLMKDFMASHSTLQKQIDVMKLKGEIDEYYQQKVTAINKTTEDIAYLYKGIGEKFDPIDTVTKLLNQRLIHNYSFMARVGMETESLQVVQVWRDADKI
ncbi:MAG: hypothetical protein A2V81_04860 [Candidatus Abawacabacteria bacterium RBG_16_42_10]|uniref:Uncharacterized protein n=1 Tax=Candidatus Abawacabacteria bacterium RBG_16_42_10 TaxID=1817814 RepID=A0A1F4XIL2_9BACT|nr:MAG: hypothetical protein A2V81_04860 [Candidatus Abawacabacteria bacterium RBG_16_42_10]